MKVTLRPTRPEDFAQIASGAMPWRSKCLTAQAHDGRVLGIGGLAFLPDGTPCAFVQLAPDATRYPVTLHKAALLTLAEAERLGLRRVVALADPDIPPAERWLLRLGFTAEISDGKTIYTWTR